MSGFTPLAGVRVLDFTWALAGPFTTFWLASAGADVIKIENRAHPDLMRVLGMRYGWDLGGTIDESPPFTELGAGKRSLSLDLNHPDAKGIVLALVERSHIVAEAFRPGVMRRLGLDEPTLRAANPDLVYISLSAWGDGTEEHAQPGYAPIFGAFGGVSAVTRYPDGAPSPVRQPMDILLGVQGTLAALAGLVAEKRGGSGASVNVSGVEAAALGIADLILERQIDEATPERMLSNGDPSWACPHDCYRSSDDRWVAIAVGNDTEWRALISVVEDPDMLVLPQDEPVARARRRDMINERVARWVVQHSAVEAVSLLAGAGVPAAVSQTLEDVASDPHLRSRGYFRDVTLPSGHIQTTTSVPWATPGGDRGYIGPPPSIGEHTAEVLTSVLGMSIDRVTELAEAGVFGPQPDQDTS